MARAKAKASAKAKPKKAGLENPVFQVKAEGDTIYVRGTTVEEARVVLFKHMGPIPESILAWKGPMALPRGQAVLL